MCPSFLIAALTVLPTCVFFFLPVTDAFATKKLRSATIESHLSAINFFHRILRAFELDTTHPVIASALKGAARLHAEVGNQATLRRPVGYVAFWGNFDPCLA